MVKTDINKRSAHKNKNRALHSNDTTGASNRPGSFNGIDRYDFIKNYKRVKEDGVI